MDIQWKIIETYFKDNPNFLVEHHLSSYNDFFNKEIFNIFREKNPIKLMKDQNLDTKQFKYTCLLYIGGKDGTKIYYGKPIIYDENNSHFMYPNEARLRNMTYGLSIHVDVDVDFQIILDDGTIDNQTITLENIFLGRFPIMINSNLCILNSLSTDTKFNMGECKNDHGGYFIIDGKEKSIVCQEKFADNMLYIRDKYSDIYSHTAEIRSVSEDASKPTRTSAIRIVSPTEKYTNNQIVVVIPNVKKPIPLFILMRALGVVSDKSIIEYCLLDLDKNSSFIELFTPSVHDAGLIFTTETALKFIATFTKGKTVPHVLEILSNYFLPHIGEDNFIDKAYFVGYMVQELLKVFTNIKKPTDRDNFKFKRVELTGKLISDLFKEYYTLQQQHIRLKMDKEYYYHEGIYQTNFTNLISNNYQEFFKERVLENGFKKAFKGNWGATEHTKKLGIVQDLNRLSFNSFMSQLRKINLPLDSSAKVIGPRLLHGSQWGVIDPVDTPDGGNVGLHKHMSICTFITDGYSKYTLIPILRELKMKFIQELHPNTIYNLTKIIINGDWIGITEYPENTINTLKYYKKIAVIPIYTSISWIIQDKTIFIFTDYGRLSRPIIYIDNDGKPSFDKPNLLKLINQDSVTWQDMVASFNKRLPSYSIKSNTVYSINDLYPSFSKETENDFNQNKAIIEYIDSAESETSLIAVDFENISTLHTHVEIHPSLIFGIMGNQVIFPENNQLPRDLFSCGQSKQAVSLYHSNYQNRIDKMGVVLNYGQIPLIKSKYLHHINGEQHPNGVNAIVAIMCYTGYNTEDAVLFNKASVERGMFNTTYFNSYEAYEESTKVSGSTFDTVFTNIENNTTIVNTKPGFDYSYLDQFGLVKENTKLDDKTIIIGMSLKDINNPDKSIDSSVAPKKGQLGFVDKTFITEGEEGFRIAKVRIREERIPAIGDKFCSRCGQKGTVGLLIPESDMPFTPDGRRPDMIINPHALPSRMTIGQLVETIIGKAHLNLGAFGDCTAFRNKGNKTELYGQILNDIGFHSSGNELLYNGFTGKLIDSQIFIGPTYYMRLKHMVKDKINYRARGPRQNLTRQTVGGRANDGGLRIGEMERDGVLAHGMSKFLNDSLMVRGDEYHIAICNKSGLLAIYNKEQNIFFSPAVDGPVQFNENNEGNMNINPISTHGNSFSILRVPYSFKLLIQELAAMNIQLRIITSDNFDQISSMSYSDNINKLLQTSEPNITNTIRNLVKDNRSKEFKISVKPTSEPTAKPYDVDISRRWDPSVDEPPEEPLPIGNYGPGYTILGEKIQTIKEPTTPDIPKPPTLPTPSPNPISSPVPPKFDPQQPVKLFKDPTIDFIFSGADGNDAIIRNTATNEYVIVDINEIYPVKSSTPSPEYKPTTPETTPPSPYVPTSPTLMSPSYVPTSPTLMSPPSPFVPESNDIDVDKADAIADTNADEKVIIDDTKPKDTDSDADIQEISLPNPDDLYDTPKDDGKETYDNNDTDTKKPIVIN